MIVLIFLLSKVCLAFQDKKDSNVITHKRELCVKKIRGYKSLLVGMVEGNNLEEFEYPMVNLAPELYDKLIT